MNNYFVVWRRKRLIYSDFLVYYYFYNLLIFKNVNNLLPPFVQILANISEIALPLQKLNFYSIFIEYGK